MNTGLLIITFLIGSIVASPICRFADLYTTEQLLTSVDSRNQFLSDIHYWEGQYGQVAYNNATGHTYDGHGLNYDTGELAPPLHYWSAPSKESIQNMMLSLAISGNKNAQTFVSPSNPDNAIEVAVDILTKKITTYENWDKAYPGFGGFLPWVFVYDTGLIPAQGWSNSVPSLDNGENIWAIYSLIQALKNQTESCNMIKQSLCPSYASLLQRYQNYLDKLKKNAYMMFYENENIRAVTQIKNATAQPYPGNYYGGSGVYYLDDPYEGELFVFFMDLFIDWPDPTVRDKIWVNKRARLQPVDLPTPKGPITVQRGYYYSAHEQWKYLEMPYLDVPINKRVFMNGERARTWNSVINGIPGLYATVSNVTDGGPITQYLSTGIPILSFIQNISDYDLRLLTPYGSFPTILANQTVGLIWYHNMLVGPRMQGPYGSTESTYTTGTMIGPVTTWDSKITTVVSMNGGVIDLVREGLKRDGVYERFYDVINREWSLIFTNLRGEDLDFQLPNTQIPQKMNPNYFTTCTPNNN